MTDLEIAEQLTIYADLIVQVGLNLRSGQPLLIGWPTASSTGTPLVAAPLVRAVMASAYRAGASYVDVMWGDDQLALTRLQHAEAATLTTFPAYRIEAVKAHIAAGGALLSITANDPDALQGADPDRAGQVQKTALAHTEAVMQLVSRNATNWLVAAAAEPAWAARVFPDVPEREQFDTLWQTIFELCRVNQPDPIAAWQTHVTNLTARTAYLNEKKYQALHYRAKGTDLTIGLPAGHVWRSARLQTEAGHAFTANLPTEEVYTMPHRAQVNGTVRATKPLSYGGNLIENFRLTFKDGRVVAAAAARGDAALQRLLGTDDGARHLGEVALVPHNSPISQSGNLFYNTLIDENAANHIALGRAYRFTMTDGAAMDDAAFAVAGGNVSQTHVDFMIGSQEMDIDGINDTGRREPLFRQGEWAFGARVFDE